MNNNNKIELSLLYDKLEPQLRSLITLGVTADKRPAISFPLIQLCLPEELFYGIRFQKSHEIVNEVENEQRISIEVEDFGLTRFPEDKYMKV